MNLKEKIKVWTSILFYSPSLFSKLIKNKIVCKRLPGVRDGIIVNIGEIRFPLNSENHDCEHLKTYLRSLYNQSHEPFTRNLIEKILKPGDVFFDVGANLGYFSAVAANAVGHNGEIYCFDVDPRCINSLTILKASNPGHRIYPYNIAVGARNERIDIELKENHTWNTVQQSNEENKTGRIHNLEMLTLSSFINTNKIQMPKLVKIDVEGAEYDVLSGLGDILMHNKKHTYIIMEISNSGDNVARICKLIDELGYQITSTVPPFNRIEGSDITSMTNVLLEPVK